VTNGACSPATPKEIAMLPNVGTWELIVILLVVFLLFGSKRLPEVASGLGKGIRAFRRELQGISDEIRRPVDSTPPTRTSAGPSRADRQSPPPAANQVEAPKNDDGPVML